MIRYPSLHGATRARSARIIEKSWMRPTIASGGRSHRLLKQGDNICRFAECALSNIDQMLVMRKKQDLRLAGQLAKNFKPLPPRGRHRN